MTPNASVVDSFAGLEQAAAAAARDMERPDKPEEACGVFGIYATAAFDVARLAYFGIYALQHRGQESAGISVFSRVGDQTPIKTHKRMGLVSQVFNEEILDGMKGYMAVAHTRYSTTGSSHAVNAQPAVLETDQGDFALAHNGNLVNTLALRQDFVDRDQDLTTTTDSELIALEIAEGIKAGQSWTEAGIAAFRKSQGAFSLVIGTPEGMMGVRDPNGIRPLVIGTLQDPDGSPNQPFYVLASETCGLDIIGAEYLRDVEPGEMVWITDGGLASHHWAEKPSPKLCVFEMIYFARPDSHFHGETLYSYRRRIGQILAQEHPIEADMVMGVPDSGIPAAIGYAEESGIPYEEGLIKNRYVGRTFIQPSQIMREAGIRMKLNPLRDVLQGKRIIVVDDSIVRGNTSRKLVQALRDAGAKEVHMRISSPPITHPCFYGIDTDSQDQLIAATKSVAEIEQQIEVDSLGYLSIDGMLKATQENVEHFCHACFSGEYPVEIPEKLRGSKLMLEKAAALA
ncbi:MAG: amidophosphoribosyltransferase [Synechococcales cyanobacterium RM1_1_8]|nr:amidophosphoribosyltransferase [Synechococcales cyanobacterium RM1_1_8]